MLIVVMLALGACNKAENYYYKLHDQPEVRLNYNTVYGVGDTMTLIGRLNPEKNLQIHIGDADARIISSKKVRPTDNLGTIDTVTRVDEVKFIITKEMGIGPNRKIQVVSANNVTNWPSIEIIESTADGILKKQLQLVKHLDYPAAAIPVFCQNGKGDIFLWKMDHSVLKIAKDGTLTNILTSSTLKDEIGTFTITQFNAAGIDPQEQNLYFSAITIDGAADNAGNQIYRLCRYNLPNAQLTTLNRTVYSSTSTMRTRDAYQPFQGEIGSVKLLTCREIVPDSKGTVYLNIGNYAVAKLSGNNLNYLFKKKNSSDFPQVWNPDKNQFYFQSDLNSFFPGVNTDVIPRAWSPDEELMYGVSVSSQISFSQFDLVNQTESFKMPFGYSDIIYGDAKPYISGSFNVLSGVYSVNDTREPGLFGYLPLPGENVLILYYQALEDNKDHPYATQYPTFGIRNFKEKVGKRYAPGKLVRNGYVMGKTDQILNYDSDGMIYMTANGKQTIVKTTYKQ